MDGSMVSTLLEALSKLNPDLFRMLILAMVATPFGVVLLVMVFWWLNERRSQAILAQYRDDTQSVMAQYGKDVSELRTFYERNVELVRNWERIGNAMQDQVILNTQTMQRLIDVCVTNQFCPNARVGKPGGSISR